MYKCFICGEKFLRLNDLTRHIWKYHRDESIICPVCGFKSKNLWGLEYHCSVRHDEQHQAIFILLRRNSRHITKIPILRYFKKYFKVENEQNMKF